MKKILVISLFILGAPAFAKDVSEIRDVQAKSEIIIYNTSGEVEVRGWSRNQVEVEADLGSGVKELIFEVDGKQVLIEVEAPEHSGRNIASDLVIRVPENSSLEISTISADITVEDVNGKQLIETVSGDIDTVAYASDLTMESVSGDIDVQGDNKKNRVRAESVSGDIEFQSLDGDVEADTVSGDVVIVDSRFENVEAATVNGDIVFHAGMYGDRRMNFETVNGDIDIKFDGDISARFDIETFNGDIRNCFGPESVRTSKYAPGRELKFTQGGGDGRVVIRTLNGDLRLCNK
jgi:DUF4097 and DUF4098 domain-containing protein YvlB